ncbi:MAG TPA: ATP synthase F1 subunit delta [Actinomycetota bacterium]|nr:ATP synthase F1 subunit delta [Actinomycetota bacterium]
MDPKLEGYAAALFEVARAEGVLDDVEDELFRFARTVEAESKLREALQDQALPPELRMKVIGELLGSRANPHTVNLLQFIVGAGKARQLSQIVDALVARAASERSKSVAEVRSAIPLGDEQRSKLRDAIKAATGKDVDMKVIVDPKVLGGLHVRVGDQVFDATIRRRLELAQESLGKS